jgi:hypothetical protein
MERRDSGVKMFLRQFSQSGLPSLAGILISSPLERYSIISQTRGLLKSPLGYLNFSIYLNQVPSREGLSGFFRGSLSRILHYFFGSAMTFRLYYYLNSLFIDPGSENMIEKSIRDGAANLAVFMSAELLAYNFERSRTLLACDFSQKTNPRTYKNSFEVFSYSLREGGILKVYSGFSLYIGSFLFYADTVSVFLKTFKQFGIENSKNMENLAFMLARIFSYPLEVLRRRKQVCSTEYFKAEEKQIYKQIVKIYREEGFLAFYKGLTPTLVQTFVCLEIARLFAGSNKEIKELE